METNSPSIGPSRLAPSRAGFKAMKRPEPPPHAIFVGSAVFHYLGPAFAVLLFARVPVLGVAVLRIVSAALWFSAWRPPWGRRGRVLPRLAAAQARMLLAWSATLAAMNVCFYEAVARLPLGIVAAI